MPEPQSTILTALLEQLITTGPESKVFTALFDLAMRLERDRPPWRRPVRAQP